MWDKQYKEVEKVYMRKEKKKPKKGDKLQHKQK